MDRAALAPRDLFKGGDLRPKWLPHRAQAVVPVSGCVHDGRAVDGASKIIYCGPPTSTKLLRVGLWVVLYSISISYCNS
jgi:hypothetical protein